MRKQLVFIATLLGFVATSSGPAAADQLAEIKQKGTLIVGVKTDYPPWGMRDTSGNIVGMEPDMAADVAKRLGVKLELVSVVSSNRMQFLQQGKIDLMIATMSDTPERRKVVGTVDPVYYASGVAILANNKAAIKTRRRFEGQAGLCAAGRLLQQRSAVQVYRPGSGRLQRRAGGGAGAARWPLRRICLRRRRARLEKGPGLAKWASFDVVQLNEWTPVPWGIAVKIEELQGPWGKFMSETVSDWLKSGKLAELEKKWVGGNTAWLTEATAKAKK